MRLTLTSIFCLFATGLLAQPSTVSRVLKNFDFEERRLGNDEDLPMHWVKIEAPGFPHYVNGRLTTDRAHGGVHSFRLDLNGGSLLYRYDPTQIPVQAGATYHIDGYIQTTPMPHARARLTAYFTDADNHPLEDSVVHSEPYAAKSDNEPWKKVSLQLSAHGELAAFLVVEVGLLQPEFYAGDTLGKHTLYPQDIRGTAWFDDVTVSQVPRVTLVTDRPGNVFRAGDVARVQMNVDDAFIADLTTQLAIHDGLGKLIYQRSGAIEPGEAEPGGGMRKKISVALPPIDAGWYRVTLATISQGKMLASQEVDIIRLPDEGLSGTPDDRFGLIATDVPFQSWNQLPELVSQLGCGRVKLGVWSSKADPEQIDPAAFDGMISRFGQMHITPTACLLDLPPSLIKALDGDVISELPTNPKFSRPGMSWLRLLSAKDEQWNPSLEYLLARHAAHLDRWQMGADGSDVFAANKPMRDVYAKVYARFSQLVRDPDLAIPWPASYELVKDLPGTVALSVPVSVIPSQLPLYIADVKGGKGHRLSLSFQLLDRDKYGRDAQVRDLVQRVVYALSAGADRIDLPCPFTAGADASIEQPQETFVAMRTLFTSLSHTTFHGKVPIAEGIECFLFDNHGSGTLVLWDTGRASGLKTLAINLGSSPRMFDVWGNEIPLLRPQGDAATGTVRLPVSTMPTFIVNIDGALAKLRTTVAIDRPLIESTYEPHTRHVRFSNTYPVAITGSLRLSPPKGWTITPATQTLSLNPGETFDKEIDIEFPLNSAAGTRTVQAEFAIQADKPVSFQLPLQIKLGLSEIGMQTMAFRDGKDVVVQVIVQNYSDKPIDYSVFVLMPGQQRQERLISGLEAGKSALRKFRFSSALAPVGTKARIGLKETDGPRLLNDEAEVR